MLPWGHFAVAFIPCTVYLLLRRGHLPDASHIIVLLYATQLPDLIDKPLAWSFHVLPSGRSLAHSVIFATPYLLLVTLIAWRTDRSELGALFTFGYLSHIYTDTYPSVIGGSHRFLPNLFWPLVPVQPDANPSFVHHFTGIEPSTGLVVKLGLLAAALLLVAGATLKDRPIPLPALRKH